MAHLCGDLDTQSEVPFYSILLGFRFTLICH